MGIAKRRALAKSFFLLVSATSAFAQTTAGTFGFPLTGRLWSTRQDFDVWNKARIGFHLGEDVTIPVPAGGTRKDAEVAVLAAGNGVVKHAQQRTGYGWVVIIEHQLAPNDVLGPAVTTLYGHLRKAGIVNVDASVKIGDTIGYLSSNSAENGGYPFTHLHFEVRKGLYADGCDSTSNAWVYAGYSALYEKCGKPETLISSSPDDGRHRAVVSRFVRPSTFILERFAPPTLTISTATCAESATCIGPQGTMFSFQGRGFVPGTEVKRLLIDPNQVQSELTPLLVADATGQIAWTFSSSCATPVGTHEIRALDVTSGKYSNTVTETITPNPACTPPPTCALTADPATITQGESSTISWATTGAPTSAVIDNDVGSVTPAGGTATVSPSSTTIYTMTVTNAAGQTGTCSAQVLVSAPPPLPPSQEGGGPPGGFISAIAVDLLNPAVLYAGTYEGGVFKTLTGGTSWSATQSGLPKNPVYSLIVDPSDSTIAYVGSHGGGVFKTTDGGASWAAVNVGLSNGYILSLAIDPSNPTTLYAGTWGSHGGEIFKTTDGGANWSTARSGIPNVNIYSLAIDPGNPAILYAGTDTAGVFKTTDGGVSWSSAGLSTYPVIRALAIDPANPSIVYAGTYGGIFKTTNGGVSWSAANSGLPGLDLMVSSLAIDPANSTTLYAATLFAGIFKTVDGGASWAASDSGLPSSDIRSLAIDPANSATVYAGTFGGGVFKTADAGVSWGAARSGLTNSAVRSLVIDPANPTQVYAEAYGGGVFKSTNGGASWSAAAAGLPREYISVLSGVLAIDPTNSSTLYAGTDFGGVFKTTDGGATWSAANSGLPGSYVLSLAIDSSNPATVYAGNYLGGVFKTTDGGASWSAANSGITDSSIQAYTLAIDPTHPATLYVGTGTGVFKSTDGGASWNAANSGLPRSAVYALAMDAASPSTLYAGISFHGVFKTSNGGASWSTVGFAGMASTPLAIDPVNSSTLYVASGSGLYKTANGGESWTTVDSGLPGMNIYSLAVDPLSPATVYAGTWGAGVFKSTDGGATWQPTGAQ